MGPEQAVRLPEINQEFIDVLSSLRQQIQDHSSGSFKKFVTENIKPQLTELIIDSLSGSLIAPNSPFEGLFVSIKDQIGFKIPNPSYGNLQRIQAPFAAAFEYKSVDLRAASQSLFEVAEAIKMEDITLTTSDQIKKNSTGYNVLNYAVTLGSLSLRPGLRVFFTPENFQTFTDDIISLINNPSKGLASKIIKTMSSSVQRNYNWHAVKSDDSYNNPNITTITQAFDDLCSKIEILKAYKKQKAKEEIELEK